MQLRDHKAKIGRVDAFRVDPRKIKIDPAHNIRDMKSERTRAHIDELKISIRDPDHGGVKKPIEVRMIGDDIFVTDGECRLTAVQELIAEGVTIDSITCINEPGGTDPIERMLNFAISGQAERYTELEMAAWCRRCLRAGATEEQITTAAGWKSKSSVKQHLEMLELLPEDVKTQINEGDISATLAVKVVKEARDAKKDPQFAAELIAANKAENERLGVGKRNKSHKVTKKTLERDAKAKATPPAQPQHQESPHAEPQSLPATASPAPVVQSASPAAVAASAEPLSGISENRVEPDGVDRERDQGVVQLAQPQNGMKATTEALLPFARISELSNLDELADDYVHEISNRDVKRAAAAWFKATGLTATGNVEQSEAA